MAGHRFGKMQPGDQKQVVAGDATYTVHYDGRQSYGDDNHPVHGASVGHFTVVHPEGNTTVHPHGPFAETEEAHRRGASPDSKTWAANHAWEAIGRNAFARQRRQQRSL